MGPWSPSLSTCVWVSVPLPLGFEVGNKWVEGKASHRVVRPSPTKMLPTRASLGSAMLWEAAPLPSVAPSAAISSQQPMALPRQPIPTGAAPKHECSRRWHVPICLRCTTLKPFCSRSGDILGFPVSEDGTESLPKSRALMRPGAGPSLSPSGPKPLVSAALLMLSPGEGL